MKPRIQCVVTQWIPGFIASGRRRQQADRHDQRKVTGTTVLVLLMGLVLLAALARRQN
jgi:hypothetical protein